MMNLGVKKIRRYFIIILIPIIILSTSFFNSQTKLIFEITNEKTLPIQTNQIFTNINNVKFIEKGFFDDDCGTELETTGVVLIGSIAYVANGDQGLEILDVSNPLKPIQLSSADTFGNALDLVVYNYIAYVAKNNGVAIFDISNPRNPILLSTIYLSDTKEVALRSNLLYVISGINGFYLFEVSNPAEPLYISNWRGNFHLNGISVISKFVCLASDGGLEIIDLTFPQRPFRGSFLNISSDIATGVDCVEINNQKFAFVAINYDGLIIVNFTLPNQPQKIAEYTDSRIIDVVYFNGFLYCSTYNSGLERGRIRYRWEMYRCFPYK
ncbi:MAG: hypothetical protein EAX90_08520 [Candidatus Heimdallarchaeota archaeon]|nr:hypothetical protein [Candidatus Heimdallarchaeota archaeon]